MYDFVSTDSTWQLHCSVYQRGLTHYIKKIPLRRIDITMVNKTVVCIFVRIPDGRRDRGTLPPLQIYTKALQTAFKAFLSRDMRGAHWFLVPLRSLYTERRVVLADESFRSGQRQLETKIGINTEVVCAYLERNTRPGIFACCKNMRMV